MGLIKKIIICIVGVGLLTACLLFANLSLETTSQSELFLKEKERKSIAFLLGSDKPGYNYFELAEQHFLFDDTEKTDVLVKSCRSIEDLINYLNYDRGTELYSNIQIVLHGNPYSGLSTDISNDGNRATAKNLVKAVMNNPLPKLETNLIDTETKINFWGCGIGKNPFINMALDSFFRLENGDLPQIYTSPHFVIFKETEDGKKVRRIKSTYWPYIFKRGYRPSDTRIALDMSKQFPEESINWSEAINNKNLSDSTSSFQNSFHIPVSWTVTYSEKNDRPNFNSFEDKMKWVKNQNELMAQIEELNIPMEKFNWTINKIIHELPSGKKVPAVKAIGMATVLCVLKES